MRTQTKKALAVISIVALGTVGVVATVSAATGGTHHQQAAAMQPAPLQLGSALTPRLKCRSLACINQTLRQLVRAVTRCEQVIPVSQFNDYLSTTPGVATSGLDIVEPGTETYAVVVATCQ